MAGDLTSLCNGSGVFRRNLLSSSQKADDLEPRGEASLLWPSSYALGGEKMEAKPFTKYEWEGFAGAEQFSVVVDYNSKGGLTDAAF